MSARKLTAAAKGFLWLRQLVRILPLALLSLALQSCFEAKHPVELQPPSALPVLPVHLEAQKGADQISLVRPRDLRSFPIPLSSLFTDTYRVNNPLIVRFGDALARSLENAGYRVQRIEDAKTAETTRVVTSDLTRDRINHYSGLFSVSCDCLVAANVKVYSGGKLILDQSFQGSTNGSGDCNNSNVLFDNALENMLNAAIPAIAGALVAPATSAPAPVAAEAK